MTFFLRTHAFFVTAVVAYLLGSIPFGYILLRLFRGEDVRASGSGNIGATNVARSSPVLGLLTLVLDALKGLAGVYFAALIFDLTTLGYVDLRLYPLTALAALCAILGHVFPVWLKFRGGKGVATGLGSFAVLTPHAVGFAVVIFLVVGAIFRRVSLASIIAVACLPFLAWRFDRNMGGVATLILIAACVLIIARHHENIGRLMTGTEIRFQVGKKA